jgi:hypothetical protein
MNLLKTRKKRHHLKKAARNQLVMGDAAYTRAQEKLEN